MFKIANLTGHVWLVDSKLGNLCWWSTNYSAYRRWRNYKSCTAVFKAHSSATESAKEGKIDERFAHEHKCLNFEMIHTLVIEEEPLTFCRLKEKNLNINWMFLIKLLFDQTFNVLVLSYKFIIRI